MTNNKFDVVKNSLKNRILENLLKAGHQTASIMYDCGSVKDTINSKKHTVTLHRTTKHLVIKTNTIGLEKCKGKQLADKV